MTLHQVCASVEVVQFNIILNSSQIKRKFCIEKSKFRLLILLLLFLILGYNTDCSGSNGITAKVSGKYLLFVFKTIPKTIS